MSLRDRVRIARRFQRSVRIDTDIGDAGALEGFLCPRSSADVLESMAQHVSETSHGAFTWTGPYGSGKSSLIVALSSLLSGDAKRRDLARAAVGSETAERIVQALPLKKRGWRQLAVVGRRAAPAVVLGAAIEQAQLGGPPAGGTWTEAEVVDALAGAAAKGPRTFGGLIVFIDEMGKFLEAAANDGSDIYIFQQLAEAASRSNGRLLVVGVLHQAFEEYASRVSRQMRDEWSKIQGRFVDLAVNAAGEEQVELISRAIESDHQKESASQISREVADHVRERKAGVSDAFAPTLERCWPLHPTTACLLGPISRRRFGQNQRSIFGFLNSAEPCGFSDFLSRADENQLYTPDRLWDYLRLNLEPSILASPDGHRWSLAAEAVERCEGSGTSELSVRVLKAIAIIDLFRERSGLLPGTRLLQVCFGDAKPEAVKRALRGLQKDSYIIYRKFLDAYAIYAGSDFDIDAAVESARQDLKDLDFDSLRSLCNLQPILAKRHFHETGALRWFELDIAPLTGALERAAAYEPSGGAIGQFQLAIPTEGEKEEQAHKVCRQAADKSSTWDVVVGFSEKAYRIPELGFELLALDKVRGERPELAGDAVARREVRARAMSVQSQLEAALHQVFNTASWYSRGKAPKRLSQFELNGLASSLAEGQFYKTPILQNELLNRTKPSPNAVAAQNALLRRMVLNRDEPELGIEGFPAEKGLYVSLLKHTGLHRTRGDSGGAEFQAPSESREDLFGLAPLWHQAAEYLESNSDRTVSLAELYEQWRRRPYGVKDGVMPVLGVAFVLSMEDKLAVYRQGIFQARITDLDIDYLAKDPSDVQLRWMDLTETTRELLSGLADIVRELGPGVMLQDLKPIDVARGLVAIYDSLPAWTKRTGRLSANAKRIRDLFKRANDPNKFLFDDIPTVLGSDISPNSHSGGLRSLLTATEDGLRELVDAYPTMLRRLRETTLGELRVPNDSPQAVAELRERAENVQQLAGDFRLDAFVSRLAQFRGSDADLEGLAGLATNKPPRDWVDPDIDRAAVELADLSQRFVRVEAFAHVKGRQDKRQAMAVILSGHQRRMPVIGEFDITEGDRTTVERLIGELQEVLEQCDSRKRNVVLAALAELSSRYMDDYLRSAAQMDDEKRVSTQ